MIQEGVIGRDTTLALRFVDAADPARKVVPAAALARSLDALQRLALLLGRRRDGQMPKQRFKPSRAEQERYRLVCDLPEPGSFLQPVRLEGSELLSMDETDEVFSVMTRVLAIAGSGDRAMFEDLVDDETWRRYVVDAIERVAPTIETGISLEIERRGVLLCTGNSIRQFAEQAARRPFEQGRSAVIGDLKKIDFLTHQITLRHRETGRELVCSYEDGIEGSLLEHPRELILVFGLVTRDDDGSPRSIDAVDHIEPVDLSPFRISTFRVASQVVRIEPPLELPVSFDQEAQMLVALDVNLGIDAFGETRQALEACLQDELIVLWRQYAQVADDNLAPDALALKSRLLARWRLADAA